MEYSRCGRSGLKLPVVSLGLWHNFGGVDRYDNARAIVHRAFDVGITHFDLAKAALLRSRPSSDPVADGDSTDTADDWDFFIHAPISGRVLRVFQESTAVVTASNSASLVTATTTVTVTTPPPDVSIDRSGSDVVLSWGAGV